MKGYMMVGLSLLAGAALIEAALVPAAVVGGAAAVVLGPKYLPKLLRRSLRPAFDAMTRPWTESAAPARNRREVETPFAAPAGFRLGQAVAKTITFRIIVTTLDFTTNYVVIGEFATAAGLSAFNLIAGPLLYLGHETAWNYFGPSEAAVELPVRWPLRSDGNEPAEHNGLTISRALAKTITFRTIATVVDFTVNYVVVGDLVTAAGLSAFAFVVGPFVYFGHEKAWEYFGSRAQDASDLPAPKLLPAPA